MATRQTRTVQLEELLPGEEIHVRGKLVFSVLAKKIEGEALRREQERMRQRGMRPIQNPYMTATITNPVVLQKHDGTKTKAETYIEESFFVSQSKMNPGLSYQVTNQSKVMPWVGVLNKEKNCVDVLTDMKSELASDLDVTLVMRVYHSKANNTNGISFDGVIINEPVRYYERNNLSQYGLTLNGDTNRNTAIETIMPQQSTDISYNGQLPNQNNAGFNPDAGAIGTIAGYTGYNQQVVQQNPYMGMNHPNQTGEFVPHMNQQFVPQNNPPMPQQPNPTSAYMPNMQPQSGIAYNPNDDTDRNY